MGRPEASIAMPYVAVVLNAVTWSEAVASQAPEILGLTLAVQVLTGFAIACVIRRERQALGVAVAIAMPIIGPLATAWIGRSRGRSGSHVLEEPAPEQAPLDGTDVARRVLSCPTPCEAIVSRTVSARRAAIARLSERATTDDVAILRWARNHPDPDIAVEAALALEDIGYRFDERIATARDRAGTEPSATNHAAFVHAVAAAILAGLVDPPLVPKLVAEARVQYDAALALDPALAAVLGVPRARIELAADQAAAVLILLQPLIEQRGAMAPDDQVLQLYAEAAYAARRFELVSMGVRQEAADATV